MYGCSKTHSKQKYSSFNTQLRKASIFARLHKLCPWASKQVRLCKHYIVVALSMLHYIYFSELHCNLFSGNLCQFVSKIATFVFTIVVESRSRVDETRCLTLKQVLENRKRRMYFHCFHKHVHIILSVLESLTSLYVFRM